MENFKGTTRNLFIGNAVPKGSVYQGIVYVNNADEKGPGTPHSVHATVIGDTKEEAEANAKLIISAPKLLEALIQVRDLLIEKEVPILITLEKEIEQAINKALN